MSSNLLHRIDPELNMARFYRVEVLFDLFGVFTLERSWGRIGTQGRAKVVSYGSTFSAEVEASRLLRAKVQRGYASAT